VQTGMAKLNQPK